MNLYEWEIWHVYSSYLEINPMCLEEVGRQLVHSGISVCSMHRDGQTHWRTSDGIQSGHTIFRKDMRGGGCEISFKVDGREVTDDISFTKEAWFEAGYFRFSEMRVFGDERPLPPPYVRAFLGECRLVCKEASLEIVLYPIIKIFESGVMLVTMRIISPVGEMSLEEFINTQVNLFNLTFDRVEVPPSLSKIATHAYHHALKQWPIHLRACLLYLAKGHDLAVDQLTRVVSSGGFSFPLAPLSSEEEDNSFDTLSSLANTLFNVVAFVLSKPRLGLDFLIRGQKRLASVGNFWVGRPHVHLVRFEEQQETSKANQDKHGMAFTN